MNKIEGHKVGIDQGDAILFSDFEHDGIMWTGTGPRQTRALIRFRDTFDKIPNVRVWLSMWDASNETNLRMDITAEDISTSGFAAVFRTWGDTKIARVRISWLAIGQVHSDDDWQVD